MCSCLPPAYALRSDVMCGALVVVEGGVVRLAVEEKPLQLNVVVQWANESDL